MSFRTFRSHARSAALYSVMAASSARLAGGAGRGGRCCFIADFRPVGRSEASGHMSIDGPFALGSGGEYLRGAAGGFVVGVGAIWEGASELFLGWISCPKGIC